MNGKRLNVDLDMWQVERITAWMRENDAGNDFLFLLATPKVSSARLEIVGWSGEAAHEAHKAFRDTLMQHFPGSANTRQDAA